MKSFKFDMTLKQHFISICSFYLKMGDWSSRDCDATCASQVIQSTIEVSQSAQEAAVSAGEVAMALESVTSHVQDMQRLTENTEGQVIQLRNDMIHLSQSIDELRESVNQSMVPSVDNQVVKIIVATLSALTLCIVSCVAAISYSNYLESRRTVRVKPKQRIDVL